MWLCDTQIQRKQALMATFGTTFWETITFLGYPVYLYQCVACMTVARTTTTTWRRLQQLMTSTVMGRSHGVRHASHWPAMLLWCSGLRRKKGRNNDCRLAVDTRTLTLYWAHKAAELRTIIQQYGDWYIGRWRVGCCIWYSEEGLGRAAAPPSPLIAIPNVTAHPSTVSVPTSYHSMWHDNCLCTMKG